MAAPQALMTRRRFLSIVAAVVPATWMRLGGAANVTLGSPSLLQWRGILMGADVSIALAGIDEPAGRALIAACTAEAARLEQLFSLQRDDSVIVRLNAGGSFVDPPADFRALVEQALAVSVRTSGAFDATVQPLWHVYADHFARGGSPQGPDPSAVATARALVGYAKLHSAPDRISFAQPSMGITLNGIAQGYITDRIAELLKARGLTRVLVNMGEYRALGTHPNGRPWRVGIRDPRMPSGLIDAVDLDDAALSTSGGYGTSFDAAGRYHHLFDPATGDCARRYLSVSVAHPSATLADALSTAFSAMPMEAIRALVAADPDTRAWIVDSAGRLTVLDA